MRIKFSQITALFLSLVFSITICAAPQLQTSVSDNVVYVGDLFTLTIELNDSDSDYQLDTKPLEKEFTVYLPSQSRSSSYINGDFTEQTIWQVRLQAKSVGELTIPALNVGKLSTESIKITVKEVPEQATETEDNQVFMENSLNKESIYLGQPLIFTSKIFIAQNGSDLDLLAPTLEGAQVSVYGKDKKGQTIRNGMRYNTITRQFQIDAQQAGSFTINSPLLTGNMRQLVSVNSWQNRVVAKPINIRGDALTIEIKAKPQNYQGEWLVSEDVRLIEETSLSTQSYHIGEPITRSITLQAASIAKEKLPNLKFNYPKNLRFYPDQDELSEGQANGLTYSMRKIRHAVIADKVGELTLPEIKLAWWNSETDKQAFAILPAQTITILPAENASAELTTNNVEPQPIAAPQVIVDNSALIYWQIFSAILALALVMVIFYHLSYRRQQTADQTEKTQRIAPDNQAYLNLVQQLNTEDGAAVYQALLHYAQSEFVTLKSLSQLADKLNLQAADKAQLLAEIKTLEQACSTATPFNTVQLAALLKKHQQQKGSKPSVDLMDINPKS